MSENATPRPDDTPLTAASCEHRWLVCESCHEEFGTPRKVPLDAASKPGLDADELQKVAFLADRAAHAVTEPRRFHEDALEQHDLGVAAADVRRILARLAGTTEPERNPR